MGFALIYTVTKIGKEVRSIGLQEHYKSHELVMLISGVWTFYLATHTIAIALLMLRGIADLASPTVIISARCVNTTALFYISWLKLFIIMSFSKRQPNEQFDKVCKKKFLNYLDEEHMTREISVEERDSARANMERFVMKEEADQLRGSRKKEKIITTNMIAVFMTFVTYGRNKRRDFLQNDLTIEDAFEAEVKFSPHVRVLNSTDEAED